MKNISGMKLRCTIILVAFAFFLSACQGKRENTQKAHPESFTFVFMTDLHLNFADNGSFDGFRQAIQKAKELGADFIITGGDNVDADVVGDDEDTARALFTEFKNIIDQSGIDFKVTIGNHDRFWHQPESTESHGAALFTEFFPETWYHWDYKGVKFIHLNTSEVCDGDYCVSPKQRVWLQNTLTETSQNTPIILVVHVPLLSFYYPALYGYYTHTDVFQGFKEIWDMFKDHNLQLVLQGHMHLYEELNVLNTQFITGGALSGSWWSGPYHGTKEGFVLVHWDGEELTWSYQDFGWQALVTD